MAEKVKNKSFADSFTLEEPEVKEFYNVRDRLTIMDDVIMYAYEQVRR